ncbi:1-(5-phosphoribosyl)-5-[(5-phosphoribosylamino)methylideneamino]imidazole-4-carboxamide isomerase [Suttonella sp. R2A3]|uniref:1-(5-phosphoribosyl)-5-[(5- phosphoribosylamino)methylideneamino]imidazole-4- carboxamide isomerase n=1 Tax=Suttonella sp. R2A3 TaxID=2908648 RepID=UPI001F32C119|nr:1-(5-phosphoribosyl)-5-[(5-phosphoribosylamino)methylideneamino]imidazole-4-carboxamide isomerase [Suttonella sp. R2A3]UJF24808.1 1-(5-phosphoribosyl)-5-[(5-phosphoribosylamino)methylideneamino]imidazole-4-carboxamide isomerase [Suttonella sp. R2A3]
MLPIPAIDLKDGQCVRLKQGRMQDATVFSDDPVEMAAHWVAQGATRLHLVDLNGAFAGSPRNADVVRAIAARFPDLPLQIGGGIRDEETAKHYWDLGVRYCIIGSKAASDPQAVADLADRYPGKIILGLDAKDGFVATDGWASVSSLKATDLAQQFSRETIAAIIYTDIAKDGMMGGVNLEQTTHLASTTDIPVIASGGVSSLSDIAALRDAEPAVAGVIVGRAIYDGAFTLAQAYETAGINA